MDSKNNYKAEDLLSNQVPKEKEHLVSDSEKELAQDLRSAVKSVGNEKLSSLEAAELWARIQNSSSTKRNSFFNWKLYLQVAAVLVMVFGLGTWQYQRNTNTSRLLNFAAQNVNKKIIVKRQSAEKQDPVSDEVLNEDIITTNDFNTVVVGDGLRSVIKLPDGSKVWLNSGSRLIYPVEFAKDSREVYLEGEAYFDVTHNKARPFYVRAKNMAIKVLGTEFYVSSNAESKTNYAVLVHGSIAFSTGTWLNKIERKLVPGERINYDLEKNKLLISQVKTEEFESWKEGYVNISSEPLDSIVQRVARYYNIQISTAGLNLKETFTGKLDFQRSAGNVLDILCMGTPYMYNSEERRLVTRKP